MSVLIDTGLFYAMQNERANRHDTARKALSLALEGDFGRQYTTDYIFDETLTLVRSRTNSFREAQIVGNRILGRGDFPDLIELLPISDDLFDQSVGVYEHYRDHELSFTDASTVALVENRNIDAVLAFDDDFDGLVPRTDPKKVAT